MRQRGEAPGARPAPGHPAGTVPAATPRKPGGCPPCLQNSLFLLFCLLKFQNSKRLDPEGLLLFKVCLHHSPGSRRLARDNGHSVWKQCLVQTPERLTLRVWSRHVENKGGLFQRRKSWTSANSAVHLALGLPATWASGSQEELQQVALSSCRMRSPCPTTAGRTSPSHPVLARFFPEGDDDKNHLHRTSDLPLAKRLHTRRCAFTLGRISSGQKENETLCS